MPKRCRDLGKDVRRGAPAHEPLSESDAGILADACDEWASACVCISGSVAAVKAPELVLGLLVQGISVDLVTTEAAQNLLEVDYRGSQPWARLKSLAAATRLDNARSSAGTHSSNSPCSRDVGSTCRPSLHLWSDTDEWDGYNAVGIDSVLHIELAKRNRLLLIAPLCANTLATAALGLCGNLLGSVLRAWYYDLEPSFADAIAARHGIHAVEKPVIVAPAMNSFMWHQRITGTHLAALKQRGIQVVPPISKLLACGDTGTGAMAEVSNILTVAINALKRHVAAEHEAAQQGKPPFAP